MAVRPRRSLTGQFPSIGGLNLFSMNEVNEGRNPILARCCSGPDERRHPRRPRRGGCRSSSSSSSSSAGRRSCRRRRCGGSHVGRHGGGRGVGRRGGVVVRSRSVVRRGAPRRCCGRRSCCRPYGSTFCTHEPGSCGRGGCRPGNSGRRSSARRGSRCIVRRRRGGYSRYECRNRRGGRGCRSTAGHGRCSRGNRRCSRGSSRSAGAGRHAVVRERLRRVHQCEGLPPASMGDGCGRQTRPICGAAQAVRCWSSRLAVCPCRTTMGGTSEADADGMTRLWLVSDALDGVSRYLKLSRSGVSHALCRTESLFSCKLPNTCWQICACMSAYGPPISFHNASSIEQKPDNCSRLTLVLVLNFGQQTNRDPPTYATKHEPRNTNRRRLCHDVYYRMVAQN